MSEAPRFQRGQQSDDGLKLSSDRKVSPRGRKQKSNGRWVPTVPNSFGLPAGKEVSCPGATDFCFSCYGVNSERQKGVSELLNNNLRLLQGADGIEGMADLLDSMVAIYIREADRQGISGRERFFRVHWDGDFFSTEYAEAWGRIIKKYPDELFFAFTRSFTDEVNVVPVLEDIENLSLYISVDENNLDRARVIEEDYPDLPWARSAKDYKSAEALAPDRPAITCPENLGRLALMDNSNGRFEHGVGACVKCQVCPRGRYDVLFATSSQDDLGILPLEPVPVNFTLRRPTLAKTVNPGYSTEPLF